MAEHAEIAARLAAATPRDEHYFGVTQQEDGTGLAHVTQAYESLLRNAPSDIAFLLDEITRLEAERDEANDEITDPWLCGIIRGLEWRASELEAEVATLKEALSDIFAKANDDHWSNARAVAWISERCLAATPTATEREGGEG